MIIYSRTKEYKWAASSNEIRIDGFVGRHCR